MRIVRAEIRLSAGSRRAQPSTAPPVGTDPGVAPDSGRAPTLVRPVDPRHRVRTGCARASTRPVPAVRKALGESKLSPLENHASESTRPERSIGPIASPSRPESYGSAAGVRRERGIGIEDGRPADGVDHIRAWKHPPDAGCHPRGASRATRRVPVRRTGTPPFGGCVSAEHLSRRR